MGSSTMKGIRKAEKRHRKENIRKLNEESTEPDVWEVNKSSYVKEELSPCRGSETHGTEAGSSGGVFVKTECNDDDEELQPPVKVFVKSEALDDLNVDTASSANTNDEDPLQCPSNSSPCDSARSEFRPVKPVKGFVSSNRSLHTKELLTSLVNSRSLANRNSNKCSYFGCNTSRRTRPDLHFFLFPSGSTRSWGERRLERWLAHCGYDVETELANGHFWNRRICSLHFDKSDLIQTSTRVVLKYDAVPINFNEVATMGSHSDDRHTTILGSL